MKRKIKNPFKKKNVELASEGSEAAEYSEEYQAKIEELKKEFLVTFGVNGDADKRLTIQEQLNLLSPEAYGEAMAEKWRNMQNITSEEIEKFLLTNLDFENEIAISKKYGLSQFYRGQIQEAGFELTEKGIRAFMKQRQENWEKGQAPY